MSKDKLIATQKIYKGGKVINTILIYERPNGTKYEVMV